MVLLSGMPLWRHLRSRSSNAISRTFMQRINGISSASLFIANMTEPKAHGMTQVQAEQASNRTLVVVVVGEDCFGGEVEVNHVGPELEAATLQEPEVWATWPVLAWVRAGFGRWVCGSGGFDSAWCGFGWVWGLSGFGLGLYSASGASCGLPGGNCCCISDRAATVFRVSPGMAGHHTANRLSRASRGGIPARISLAITTWMVTLI